jgi:hypothetical protein
MLTYAGVCWRTQVLRAALPAWGALQRTPLMVLEFFILLVFSVLQYCYFVSKPVLLSLAVSGLSRIVVCMFFIFDAALLVLMLLSCSMQKFYYWWDSCIIGGNKTIKQ